MTGLVPALPLTALPGWIRGAGRDSLAAVADTVADRGSPLRIALPGGDRIMVTRPADVERIYFTDQDAWPKGDEYDIPGLALRRGLVTSRGERWRRDRAMLNPLFSKRNLAPLTTTMAQRSVAWADERRDGETIDAYQEMQRLALDIATRTMFGDVLPADETRVVAEALEAMLRELAAIGRSPFLLLGQSLPGIGPARAARWHPRSRRIDAALERFDAVVLGLMRRRRDAPDAPRDDLLAQLLRARDPDTGEPLTEAEIVEQSVTFLLAGHETTGTGLAWTWHLLGTHPAVRERLEEELERVLGGRDPVPADLEALHYTRAVFSEALRLHPPVYVAMRRAGPGARLGDGYRVREGTIAIVVHRLVHRDPDTWPDPDRFDPDRFLTDDRPPRGAYVPFGGGRRGCIGIQFAALEAGLVLATVAQRLRLRPRSTAPVVEEALTTLRPRGGLPMTVEAR